ncbi:hypothetical protein TcCL_Unassigned01620 [Trypanosoma cruzi]|nr:hypothetical protein TcCL_Unassigned01620 [Trypanosoma cruzi]
MEHRHRRIDRRYYLCPTAQARGSPLHSIRRLGLTRIDATLTRGEEAAPARLRTGVSHTIRMAATAPATRHPEHMPLVRRGCPTAGTQRTSHGNASSSRWTPLRHDPTPGRLPGVRQALQLPY